MKARSSKKAAEVRVYNRIRALILEEADYQCDARIPGVCLGYAGNLHHRLPLSHGGKATRENLLPVCGSGTTGCHGWIEHHRAEAYELGFLLHSWDREAS